MDIDSALELARSAYAQSNARSAAAHQHAARFLPGGNTRSTLYFAPFPLSFESGHGAKLTDLDGHEYVDFLGEYTAGVFGHSNELLLDTIKDAAANGMSLGGHTVWEARLAEALCSRFPVMELVQFTTSGTEANLFALAAAKTFSKRQRVLVFQGAYHGGVLTFANLRSVINVPHDFVVAQYNDPEGTCALLDRHRDTIGCVIAEPMMSSAGCIPADPSFLKLLREATALHDMVLIFDEVVTSRLAPGGIHAELAIAPDLITLGKWIGGGMNIGAFGGRRDIMAQYDPRQASFLPHGGTFNNNVLTMRAGQIAVSNVYDSTASRLLNERGSEMRRKLNDIAAESQLPMTFAGIGAMTNIHMARGEIRCPDDALRGNMKLRELYYFHLLSRGVYLARRGMMTLSLPMTEDDISRPIDATEEFVQRYASLAGRER